MRRAVLSLGILVLLMGLIIPGCSDGCDGNGGGNGNGSSNGDIPSSATPETLEEILAQAADVKQVKYDCVYTYFEGTQIHKVWFKGNKMKVETSFEGQVETYLLDMDTGTVYRWVSPENEPRESGIAPGEISDFVSAMSMAESISLYNPTIIGSENLDGKDCLVVEYVVGDITIKAWLWKEQGFLVRWDLISSQRTTTIEFKNIDFGDIPDSVFELP